MDEALFFEDLKVSGFEMYDRLKEVRIGEKIIVKMRSEKYMKNKRNISSDSRFPLNTFSLSCKYWGNFMLCHLP